MRLLYGNEVWIGLLTLWVLPWKGVALWRAAQRKEQAWFIVLLIVNTIGLLEMFYVLYWTKRKHPERKVGHQA